MHLLNIKFKEAPSAIYNLHHFIEYHTQSDFSIISYTDGIEGLTFGYESSDAVEKAFWLLSLYFDLSSPKVTVDIREDKQKYRSPFTGKIV